MTLGRGLIGLSAAIAIFLAGCGDNGGDDAEPLSTADYRAALLGLDSRKAESLYYELVTDEPLPQERCAVLIRSFHDEVSELVESVSSRAPPTEVAEIHERMVIAAEESVARVGEIAEQVESGEVECGNEINKRLYGMPSTDRAQSALDDLREPVGLPSGE